MAEGSLVIRVTRQERDFALVRLEGEIDVYCCPRLKETVLALIDQGTRHFVFDMEAVLYLDSAALGVLLGLRHRLQQCHGSASVAGLTHRVLRIFQLTRLDRAFAIYQDTHTAVSALRLQASTD